MYAAQSALQGDMPTMQMVFHHQDRTSLGPLAAPQHPHPLCIQPSQSLIDVLTLFGCKPQTWSEVTFVFSNFSKLINFFPCKQKLCKAEVSTFFYCCVFIFVNIISGQHLLNVIEFIVFI